MGAIRRSTIIRVIAILLLGVPAFELMSVAVRLLDENFQNYKFRFFGIFGIIPAPILLIDRSSVSVFEYFGIVMSFFMDWLFSREMPISMMFPGVLLLVGARLPNSLHKPGTSPFPLALNGTLTMQKLHPQTNIQTNH